MTLWWDLCAVYVIPRHPTLVLFLERKMVSLPEKSLGEGGNEANLDKQTYREKQTKKPLDISEPFRILLYPLTLLSLCLSCSRLTCVEGTVLWRAGAPC